MAYRYSHLRRQCAEWVEIPSAGSEGRSKGHPNDAANKLMPWGLAGRSMMMGRTVRAGIGRAIENEGRGRSSPENRNIRHDTQLRQLAFTAQCLDGALHAHGDEARRHLPVQFALNAQGGGGADHPFPGG